MAIRFILLLNRAGKTRLARWYEPYDEAEKRKMTEDVHRIVTTREARASNFCEYRTCQIVYRRYAGLFFVIAADSTDSALAYLELIHLIVESLDAYFGNVCELDLVFNFARTYMVLDEIVLGGEIQDTSRQVILQRLVELDRLE
eukprot:TRINITY_DN7606_c0_g1_i1.p1 TRINITY_DN7606_c0_g1~~TRINITY_DN7606_c0_g1_i1.p1  ORF type:complete len:152 (-),score=70.61 TRINITY_DN7606_c0_g1_i1:19-450(-)